ncbi:MAG: hypothetical protein M1610_01900 [Nitrospirae bacterium]|nr:hypothetical protein [Nitrospirota bacterium]MDA8339055.1 hypothetical protein [Nitrospiraceae bacterium]
MFNGIRSWFKKDSLENIQITTDLNEIRKRARILFIDDEDVPQIKVLKKEGFAIDQWKDIKNLKNIEDGNYDIIFLDIGGVGGGYSREGAIGVLKDIKKSNPSIVLIAFSGQKFAIEQTKFFQLADDVLNKDARAVEIKNRIEDFLKEKFSVVFYRSRIKELLNNNGVSGSEVDKVEKKLYKSIQKKDRKSFESWVKKSFKDAELIASIINLSTKLIEISIK